MTTLHIDFETRSPRNILNEGARKYLSDPDASILCAAWAVDDGPVCHWDAVFGHSPKGLIAALESCDECVAHNATFERLVIEILGPRYGLKQPKRWRCTAYKAASANLPRSLGGLSDWFKLNEQGKDKRGAELIKKCCCPDKKGKYCDDTATLEALRDYCRQDVVAERVLDDLIPDNTEEWLYQIDCDINDRGLPIDRTLCVKSVELVDSYKHWANTRINELTEGVIMTTDQVSLLKRWLISHGVNVTGVSKEVLEYEIPRCEDPIVREVMQLRLLSGSAAVKKYASALAFDLGGKVYDQLLLCGASQTGRWASKGVQIQNMFRGAPDEVELDIIKTMSLEDIRGLIDDDVLGLLQRNVRGLIQAPDGETFVAADLSGIEARVLPWLAGSANDLRVFKLLDEGKGPDPYRVAAARFYKIDVKSVTPKQRGLGKILVLSCGYGVGPARVYDQAHEANLDISVQEAENAVRSYREGHQQIVTFWYAMDRGFREAVAGKTHRVNRHITFVPGDGYVSIRLPNGRKLYYWEPRVVDRELTFLNSSGNRERTYGAMLAQGATQATARDFLALALKRCDEDNIPVIGHVHDEIISQVPIRDAEDVRDRMVDIMRTPPSWAYGIPLNCEAVISKRYTK